MSLRNSIAAAMSNHLRDAVRGWDTFWFQPTDPATLSLIRVCAGAMLFYAHLVWSIDLLGFFGPNGRITPDFVRAFFDSTNTESHQAWSYLHSIQSPTILWALHIAALIVFFMLTIGLFSRASAILAAIITISYVHRSPGAQFGLDQINVLLSLYLCIGPCGALYSVDRWRRQKRASNGYTATPRSTSANIAIRLIQCHLCVIYLFAGLGKLLGVSWWEGTALWRSLANYEYQSINMLWLAHYPWLINLLTHIALAWEISYVFLIWSKRTRPLVLALAIPVHLGIAMCLGMVTFGTVMLIANLAFVSPVLVRELLGPKQVTA